MAQLGALSWAALTGRDAPLLYVTIRQAHKANAFTSRVNQKARDDSPGSREKGGEGGIEKKYDPAIKNDLSI